EVVRSGKADRAAANHRNFERQLSLDCACVYVNGVLRFRSITLGEKALQRAYGDGLVDLRPPTRGFAGVCTDASADAGQRIGPARVLVGFLKSAFGDEADVPPGVGV